MVEPVVVHQPPNHVYVRHLGLSPGPAPAATTVWDVDTLVSLDVDIVHVHFGFEHLTPSELGVWLARIRDAGIALVHTVHDVDNPHLDDQRTYHRLTAQLVDAAAIVLTLTPAAAAAIRDRFRRDAVVVPHPHVVPPDGLDRNGRPPGVRRGVYVHAATLRPNLDIELIGRLAEAAGAVGGMNVHIRDTAPTTARRRLEHLAAGAGATVEVGPRPGDDELWSRLGDAALVALPYRWGTHSGLLEAAHDVGTPTVAPAFGGYGDQGASLLDHHDLAGSLRRALTTVTDVAERQRHRSDIAAAHRRVYRKAVA